MTRALLCRPVLSLNTLEEIWKEKHSEPDILSILQPTLTQMLIQPDQHLFLDMVKFVAMLLTELYEKTEDHVLANFVERFLIAVHFTANRYYDKDTFDQNRYLDCVAATLSIWTDCTKTADLIIPKIVVFTRQSQLHVLDAIIQSLNISGEIKCQLLDQITSLANIDIYVKYTIASRGYPKYQLHSQHPSEDAFRCWLLKHNIANIRSVSDFLESSTADEDLLSSMCRTFYTLPATTSESNSESTSDLLLQADTQGDNSEVLFYIDRGEKVLEQSVTCPGTVNVDMSDIKENNTDEESSAKEGPDCKEDEAMSVDLPPPEIVSDAPLAPKQVTLAVVPTVEPAEELPTGTEPCIKIKNLRKRRSKPPAAASDVIVVKLPTTPAPEAPGKVDAASTNPLTEETLAALPDKPSVRKTGRARKTSEESVTSVDSVASRTRHRGKTEHPPLQAISEEGTNKFVEEKVTSTRKSAKTSTRKMRTPKTKSTPKCGGSSIKQEGAVERIPDIIDETPQMPARKTRSRKLNV